MINLKTKKTYQVNQVFNPFNLAIQLSYFRNKVNALELKITKLELKRNEVINEIIRMKLGESK